MFWEWKILVQPFYLESLQGLFAEMVQQYYSCICTACSIPKVRVLGSQEDWNLLAKATSELYDLFKPFQDLPYLKQVVQYTSELATTWNQSATWSNFFHLKICGSGGDPCTGDFTRLLNERSRILSDDLPNTLSRFPFENSFVAIEQKDSYFVSGIIGGNIDDEAILVPVYDFAITYIQN